MSTEVKSETPESEIEAKINELKTKGNALFSKGRNEESIKCFTEALSLVTPYFSVLGGKTDPNVDSEKLRRSGAILLSNRANAYLRMGRFEMALEDASLSVNIDPEYPKGYFRRGTALFNVGRIKEACSDFQKASKLCPTDPGIKVRISECERQINMEEAAVREGDPAELEKLMERVRRECSVAGPSLFSIPSAGVAKESIMLSFPTPTQDEIEHMTKAFTEGGTLNSHCVANLIVRATDILKTEKTLNYLDVEKLTRLTVVGDLHGQFFDLLTIFSKNGVPGPNNAYLFNGDFVDRGSWGCEIVITLLAYKVRYPDRVFFNRGNHETATMNKVYGFEWEIIAKYGKEFVPLFTYFFSYLPLAHIINKNIIVVHGGLHPGSTLDEISAINRICQPPDAEGLFTDLLWADPRQQAGWIFSIRGRGVAFGPDITSSFLAKNGLRLVIRSHEVAMEGYRITHGGKLVTLFSAPNYCDRAGNLGAYAVFTGTELRPEFFKFAAAPHPATPPLMYVSPEVKSILGIL